MKKIVFSTISLFLLVTLVVLSCKKPEEGLAYIFTSPDISTAVNVVVVDAATGDQLGINGGKFVVDVAIEGPDKASVVNNQGNASIVCINGLLSVGIKEGIVPTEANPLNFTIIFSKSGYISTSLNVRLTKTGYTGYEVRMVNLSNLPEGVATVRNTQITTNAQGATTSTVTFSSPVPQTTGEATKATLTVPAGTIFKDKNNVPLVGNVTAQMTYFNNTDESSLKGFPGGFMIESAGQPIIFKSGGFVALDMTIGGKEVKNFSSPISMTLEMPAASTDHTGTPIFNGMTIPIWSYEPSTGIWTEESIATIVLNGTTSKYEVTFDMNHLSYWNTDWRGTACSNGRTFEISSNYTGSSEVSFNVYNGDTWVAVGTQDFKNGANFTVSPYPDIATTWKVQTFNPDLNSYEMKIVNVSAGCSKTTVAVQFPEPKPIEIDLIYTCPSKNTTFKPWMPIYYRPANAVGPKKYTFAGFMLDGKIFTNCFYYGVPYKIATLIGETYIESPGTFTASKPYHSMSEEKCF